MIDRITLDTLINHVVFTIDNLFYNKDYPQELLDYLYLIATGMIINYGDEYIDIIYNAIKETKYSFFDISNQYNKLDNMYYYNNPTSHNYLNKYVDFNSKFPSIQLNYELLYKNIDSSFIKTLEYLTYELNFILFNRNKKISVKDNFKLRFDYLKKGIATNYEEDKTIYKVFNILQAEDVIKVILSLRNNDIGNVKFNNSLCKLNNIDYNIYKMEGLDILVNLFRPLYKYNNFKIIINTLDNDKMIEEEFDKVLGDNSYNKVCDKLDLLSKNICMGIDINYFKLSKDYVSIRNDFINRYISLKYI